MSSLEIAANAVMTVSIGLAARNSIRTWVTGIGGCILFGVLFFASRLYADATLQLFFIATSAIGWWQWYHPRTPELDAERRITRARPKTLLWMAVTALLVAGGYGFWLHSYTNAFFPYLDSTVLALSVMAQLLLMQRRVETWPVWLLVNSLSVVLFATRGLILTAVLYSAYWVNAWYGWWKWRNEMTGVGGAVAS